MSHSDFLSDMYNEYKNDKEGWTSNPNVVLKAINKYYSNDEEHYKLLRLITYRLDEQNYNEQYLDFLKTLLFTLLEENAISLIHKEGYNSKTFFNEGFKNILKKDPEIFIPDNIYSISNTQVTQLIDKKLNDIMMSTIGNKRKRSDGGHKTKKGKATKEKSKKRKSKKRKSKKRKIKKRNKER
tara:strand:- start:235 stop:783 length:549 start_codon:yes stop_codon:yes gene_type:complete